MKKILLSGLSVLALTACANEGVKPDDAVTEAVVERVTSTVKSNPDKNAYFGDLHIHTKNSFDAYIFNVRSTPDDVYRFAKGEGVMHPAGYEIKLGGPPLDFVATTDHGAYMGILPAMNTEDHPLSKVEMAKDMFGTDPELITNAFALIGGSVRSGEPYPEIYDRDIIDSAWKQSVDAANRHYEPGKLTTFSGYEYTAVTQGKQTDSSFIGGNLHRNVIFENEAPKRLFATLDSVNPEDLWDWMDEQRAAGRDVMAIPHNSNVSDGEMFDLVDFSGNPLTKEYAEQRVRNEPIVEMSQVKGTSETHPALSPNDEWADFEIYEDLLSSYVKSKINGSYVREALSRGLAFERELGANPYKFGMIGSSDTHVAGGSFDEEEFWSKVGILDATPEARGSVPPGGARSWEGIERDQNAEHWFSKWSASGYAAVWAEENTREAIYGAMRNKESFATSGTRIKVRFFGSSDFDDNIAEAGDLVKQAYATGVPMGGDLSASDKSPEFLVWAARDPRGAPLQRIQIVKAWEEDGAAKESLFDVVCSDGLSPDPATHRCADNGASVNLEDCSISTDKGAPELKALWSDPAFDPKKPAAYYVRVLENPTCRWSTWDAMRAGVERHPDLPPTLQERAWTSPIWYNAR